MMKIIFLINSLIFITTLLSVMRMVMFQKAWLVFPDGTLPDSLDVGTYNIAVFGSEVIKKLDIYVETTSGITPRVDFLFMPSTGMSNFRVFTRFAKFRLDTPSNLKVSVTNIGKEDIKLSRLLLKRLLFRQSVRGVEVIITPRFNYTKFFLLVLLAAAFFTLLFFSIKKGQDGR